MPHPNAREQIVVFLPDGGQLLVSRWIMQDDRIDVDYRSTTNVREAWRPIDLVGGSFTVGLVE